MALKDIFTMVKADRYTQDGREEVIKARNAETEDARQPKGIYHWKSGDYRKQGDKYVKIGPGTGGAGKTPGAKTGPGKTQNKGAGIPKLTEKNLIGKNYRDLVQSMPRGEFIPSRNIDNPDGSSVTSFTNPKKGTKLTVKFDKSGKITSVESHGNPTRTYEVPAESKSVDKEKLLDALSFDLVDTTADIEEEYNAVEHSDNSRLPEFVRQEIEREYVNKINGEKWSDAEKDIIAEEVTRRIKERQSKSRPSESKPAERDLKKELWSDIKKREGALHAKGKWRNLEDDPEYAQLMKQYREMDEDAAPRALTGDCKIRVRK